MNKRWLFSLLIVSLVVTSFSCGISVDLGSKGATQTPIPPAATGTAIPVTATNTAEPAATPTIASIPTEKPAVQVEEAPMPEISAPTQQALEPTSQAEPPLQVISPENAASLTLRRMPDLGWGSLQKVLVSPNGSTILLSFSSTLALINVSDLSVVWQVDPGRYISDIAFSEDEQHLVAASPGGSVHLIDVATGNTLATIIPQREGVRSLSLSGQGKYFAVLDYSGTTTIWDTGIGKQIQDNNGKANPGGINSILLSPGGGTLLIDGIDSKVKKTVQQWNVTDGQYKIGLLGVIDEMVNWKFSPDAKRVFGVNTRSLTASPANTLTAWNALNGAIIKRYDSLGIITDYEISPDGARIIVATEDNQIHLLDVESGQKKGTFSGHTTRIAGMAFSPDGQGVISVSVDGKTFLWDVVDLKTVKEFQTFSSGARGRITFSTEGTRAAILSPDYKKILITNLTDIASSRVIGPEEYLLRAPTISLQGNLAAAMDEKNRLTVWDATNGQKVQSIETRTRQPITRLKFAPNEKLVTSLSEGQIMVWDIATGKKLYELTGQNDFAFSPVERIIVSDSLDNKLYFSDADTGKKLYSTVSDFIDAITYAPGGETIAVGGTKVQPVERGLNNLIYQLDTHTKERLPVEFSEIQGSVSSVVYSPDMRLLAACDSHGNVLAWNLSDGQKVAFFEEVTTYPGTLAFTNDGTVLLVGGGDGSIGIISTTGMEGSAENTPATTTGEDSIPDLSALPYTHSKGSVTINLPMGWVLKEQNDVMFTSTAPGGIGNIAFMAINTITPLTDEGFLKFIDGSEQAFSIQLPGYSEIDRGVEPAKGTGFVSKTTTIAGKEYISETYYTRVGAQVHVINFLTQKAYYELYLSLYQGVFASLKVNTDYISKQIPFSQLNTIKEADGKFSFSIPTGWGSTGTDQPVTYTAPDGSAFLRRENVTAPQGDDTQTFIALQTLLEKQEATVIIVRRDKTDSGGWQMTYNLPDKNKNGTILGIRDEATLQLLHIQYPADDENLYRLLAAKVLASFKKE